MADTSVLTTAYVADVVLDQVDGRSAAHPDTFAIDPSSSSSDQLVVSGGPSSHGVRWATRAATLATLAALAVGVVVMVPRLHSLQVALGHVRHAQLGWLAGCIAATFATCLVSACGLRAAVGHRLAIRQMVQLELAASTANRFAPGGIGGVGLKSLYLCRHGATPSEAAAALGTIGIVGATVHVIALTITTIVTGGQIELPLPLLFGLGVALIVLAGAMALAKPTGRMRRGLDRARQTVVAIVRNPRRLGVLVGSAASVTGCNIVALAFACRSVGADASLFTIASIYLTGRAVAAAAPTPNGLGATEAAMIAGFATAGVVGPVALAAVLVYRLVSFWLPILPGVISARRLRAA